LSKRKALGDLLRAFLILKLLLAEDLNLEPSGSGLQSCGVGFFMCQDLDYSHFHNMVTFAVGIGADPFEAEDIVQEAYINVWKYGGEKFSLAYLYGAVRLSLFARHRHLARLKRLSDFDTISVEDAFDDKVTDLAFYEHTDIRRVENLVILREFYSTLTSDLKRKFSAGYTPSYFKLYLEFYDGRVRERPRHSKWG